MYSSLGETFEVKAVEVENFTFTKTDTELERQRQEELVGSGGSTAVKTSAGIYDTSTVTDSSSTTVTPPPKKLQRFYGSVDLDFLRVSRDVGL